MRLETSVKGKAAKWIATQVEKDLARKKVLSAPGSRSLAVVEKKRKHFF